MTVVQQSLPSGADVVAGSTHRRRNELAEFLRACRARIRPEDVGLPAGARRRTPGLRREEVAQLAAVGVTWYTWLEQGRPINASVQVLDAVARVLRLSAAQRRHLYFLAEVAAVEPAIAEPRIDGRLVDIVDALDPLAACVVNARFDVLVYNQARSELFACRHSPFSEHSNVLWCCFTEPEIRERFLNFDEVAPVYVGILRRNYANHLGDRDWSQFIRRLYDASTLFASLWDRHEVAEPQNITCHFRHPQVGRLDMVASSFDVTGVPETRLVVYSAVDDATRERLADLRDRRGR